MNNGLRGESPRRPPPAFLIKQKHMKYDYQILYLSRYTAEKTLSTWGSKGWRVFSISPSDEGFTVFLEQALV